MKTVAEVMVGRFENFCISDGMDGREDVKEVGNFGSENESVRSECQQEIMRQVMGVVNGVRLGKLNKG
jgi:hypothetical protein